MTGLRGAAHERVGQRLGRYELRYLVAQGGMASVYLAQLAGAHQFERWVAIKVMHQHLAGDEGGFVEMFLDEARLAARIQHPNVCQVLDFGEQDGTYYIVMEYLHGETLSALIKRAWQNGALSPVLAASLVAMVARGLHAAHTLRGRDRRLLNVVHRDVSPQNMIVLYDGMAKITDFGIARARGRLSQTQAGMLKGKFAYMSPEQLNGEDIDRRADIWSLGVVLWEATLGRHLFRSQSEGATAIKVVQGPIPRPREMVEGYPEALDALVMEVLERDPKRRIQDAETLATRLEEFCRSQRFEHWGQAEIAEYMATLFEDRLRQREEMLAAELDEFDDGVTIVDLHSGSTLGSRIKTRGAEPAPASGDTASVEVDLEVAALPTAPLAPAPLTPAAEARASRRPWWALPAIALGLVLGLAVGGLLFILSGPSEPDAVAAAPSPLPTAAATSGSSSPGSTSPPVVPADEVAQAVEAAPADVVAPVAAIEAPAVEAAPAETAPTEAAPAETAPAEVAPAEVAPAEAAPAETAPAETAPAETAPGDASGDEAVESEPSASSPTSTGRARRAPAQPVGEGTLNLLAIPRAEVRWRGRLIGTTPLINHPLPAGSHRLVLRATDGSGERAVRVRIVDGERTRESVTFDR